jgi:hypothetical protein
MSAAPNRSAICDACETVAHCLKKGCVPLMALPLQCAHRPICDHAPEIAETLLSGAEQRTRMHRALAPEPAPVATNTLAARLAAHLPEGRFDTPSLCVLFVILFLAFMAAAGLLGLIVILTGYRP